MEHLAAQKILKSKMMDASNDVRVVKAVLHGSVAVPNNIYTGPDEMAIASVEVILGTVDGQVHTIVTGYQIAEGGLRIAGQAMTRSYAGIMHHYKHHEYRTSCADSIRNEVYDVAAKLSVSSWIEALAPARLP